MFALAVLGVGSLVILLKTCESCESDEAELDEARKTRECAEHDFIASMKRHQRSFSLANPANESVIRASLVEGCK